MNKLDTLLRGVADEQDALRARDSSVERLAIRLGRVPARAARRAPVWVALAAALALVLAFVGGRFLQHPARLAVAVGGSSSGPLLGAWLGAPDTRSLPLEFSDGSRFELTPKSRARVLSLGGSSARVELGSGSVRVHVVPGHAGVWHIDAGPFGVRVTGTRFVVSYVPEGEVFELTMEEGQVELSGCVFGNGRKLTVGQRVRAACRTRELEVGYRDTEIYGAPHAELRTPLATSSAAVPPQAAPAPVSASQAGALAKPETAGSAVAPASNWLSLARAGKYSEAYAAAQKDGFDAECRRASPEALTLLADVARHARAPREAKNALLTLRRRFVGTTDAALAAFALGRLEFDEFRAYSSAADWFRAYLAERPAGPMAREALGRLMEASDRAGDHAGARAMAARYLHDYPSGPHAAVASRLVPAP